MLIKCDAKCACQYDGYCIRKWQGLQCRDITHGKYQDIFIEVIHIPCEPCRY
ncbi:hypothetical protein SAMN04490178_10935 [Propionispora vibrioides]|uniref:Uncharacterized protein n=1 Tax=Propionispora vibrioides TaxID=112903 RepID=A0A1H8ULR0_9FIRM|nr:hypothetical protein SAMN04490178_10935 [Propionispora vibrioides]